MRRVCVKARATAPNVGYRAWEVGCDAERTLGTEVEVTGLDFPEGTVLVPDCVLEGTPC